MVGKNRYLFSRIIKFLYQALEAKCFISKTHVYTTQTWKSQRHTHEKVNMVLNQHHYLGQGRKNRDVFYNCKNLGLDYISNFIILIYQMLSRTMFFPNKHCFTESV